MKKSTVCLPGLLMALAVVSGSSFAQTNFDFGKNEYMASCASCHGVSAKGDGEVAPHLVKAPTDLTTLTKRSGGVFPSQYAREVIDGRSSTTVGSHGVRDMPIWGQIYRAEDTQPADLHARNRISSLLDYLARIQVK
jgi:mono/diheme cytochrome c family protein